MYVCICNPFTETDVIDHLESHGQKTRVKDVYAACSGGEKMNCGSCSCDLKQMVDTHNNGLTIGEISDKIEHIYIKQKEPV